MDIMDINNSEFLSIFNKLGDDKNYKLKFIFDRKKYNLSRNLFTKIVERFIYNEKNGGMNFPYKMNTELLIQNNIQNIQIKGKNEVKKYWQFNIIPDNAYVLSEIIETNNIDEYGISINLEKEKIGKEESELIGVRIYQFRNIYEISDPKFNFYTNLIEEKQIETEKGFRDSACIGVIPEYYLEIILPNNIEKEGFIDYFGKFLRWILEELQQTNFIITLDDQINLDKAYKKLIKRDDLTFVQPVEILRRNFHKKGNISYVREDYAICYNLDGEHRYLFIAEHFSGSIDGTIFMISEDGKFINTGKKVTGFSNTLVDGYYSDINNLFYITDVIFYKGVDVRKNIFYKQGSSSGGSEKYRFDYLMQFSRDAILSSTLIDPDLKDDATKIIVAKYLFGSGTMFEDNLDELFEKIKIQDFIVSGLLFRPINKAYPEKGGNWYELFKWNYPEYRRAEFLVKYVKNGNEDKISPFQLPSKGKDLEGKIIQYKSLQLFVGGIREVGNKKIITIVDFLPRGTDPSANINIANIPLSDSGDLVAHNYLTKITEEIPDNSIVEFVYQRIYGEYTDLFKWTPVKVNHLKTKLYREGQTSVLISDNYANHLWNSLANTITETQMKEGNVPEEDLSHLYYALNNSVSVRLKKYPFQIFHNRVVKDKLIMGVCPGYIKRIKGMEGSLLDLAAGTGGDSLKWKLGKLKNVVGIEIVRESVEIARNMYATMKGSKPNTTYIWGDSGKLIFPDYDSALDGYNKNLLKKVILSKNQFDVVSMQYAIHYLCENEIKLRTFLQNVTDNLKIGGYFIGTSMDGGRIYELLKDLKKPAEGIVGEDILWRIDKKYQSIMKWDKKKPMLGHKIDVFINTIGIPHEEYLVNYEYLDEICKEYGFEKELIRSFGEIYNKGDDEYKNDLKAMSDAEKTFSFLHNEFKFIKKKDASDAVYKKLLNMIEKQAKKEEKIKNMKGGNTKIILKLRL